MLRSESTGLRDGDALLVVDVQRDFLPGGSLAVRDGDAVVPVLNAYLARWTARGLPVFASRCWHPPDHCSFHARGGPWPPHCIAGTPGAAPPPGLALPASATVVSKATTRDADAYSAFDGTDLDARLRAAGVRRLFVGGLAADYCVAASVREALARGYDTVLLADAVRAVDARPGDSERAAEEMAHRGARATRLDLLDA